MFLYVGARPPPPRNVSARIEGSVIRVYWLPPHTNMSLYYYIIEWSTDGQKWQSFDERIKVPYTFFIWQDARPNMEYYFRVYSYSITAYSVSSEVVMIRTPPAESRSINWYLAFSRGFTLSKFGSWLQLYLTLTLVLKIKVLETFIVQIAFSSTCSFCKI